MGSGTSFKWLTRKFLESEELFKRDHICPGLTKTKGKVAKSTFLPFSPVDGKMNHGAPHCRGWLEVVDED
jgi:hypothetical protein